jgi:hypothetical protein
MLLSRFWYFLLAAALGATLTAALLAQAIVNRQYDSELAGQLRRDRLELELWMRLDARARIDAIAPFAAHGDVRGALRKANARREPHVDPAVRRDLEKTLRTVNKQLEEMRGDVVFALDATGVIVAQLGASDPPAGSGLGSFPLVERALAGYLRDDVWLFNGNLYRMAARPVFDRGEYVGALVHGMLYDDRFAQRIADRLPGATVGFFMRDRLVASHTPAGDSVAPAAETTAPLADVLGDPELQKGNRTEPRDVGENARAVYSLLSGNAAHAGAGYVIARPRQALASPFDIFDRASSQDVENLPWALATGAPLLLFALGMLWVWFERDRPLIRLRDDVAQVANRTLDRLDISHYRGRYRRIAENVNTALDKAVAQGADGAARRPADLDQLLGPATGSTKGGGAYFGFASDKDDKGDKDEIPSFPPPPGTGSVPKVPAAPKVPSVPLAPPPAATPAPAPRPPAPAPRAPAPPMAPPAAAAPRPPPPAPPRPAPPAPHPGSNGDGATAVAPVPPELLAAATGGNDEERHFREVYEQYVAMKESCGEATAGLTFEKFCQTLRKNREQIVQRHGAKGVRFSVYEKNGKAALKATPVKS